MNRKLNKSISDNANRVASAIRAKLKEESSQQRAEPVLDDTAGAELYVTPPCEAYIAGASGNVKALEEAEERIKSTLLAYDYEKQA